MKNKYLFINFVACCFFCHTSAPTAKAQVSQTQSRVAELLAITRPGYYIQQKVLGLTANLDPCDLSTNCRQGVLPVTLLYFTGERLDHENVLLKWETGGEVNNDYFQLERTLNPGVGFETVGTIKGRGTTSSNMSYQSVDRNDYNTYTYYRLKQVDLDGKFHHSTIISVKGGDGPLVVTAFPNPGQVKHIRFKISGLRQTSGAIISVYDIQGKIIYQNLNLIVSPEQDVKLDLPNVPAGKYNIKVAAGDRESVSSFVLIQ